jgi:hypothetical protein
MYVFYYLFIALVYPVLPSVHIHVQLTAYPVLFTRWLHGLHCALGSIYIPSSQG